MPEINFVAWKKRVFLLTHSGEVGSLGVQPNGICWTVVKRNYVSAIKFMAYGTASKILLWHEHMLNWCKKSLVSEINFVVWKKLYFWRNLILWCFSPNLVVRGRTIRVARYTAQRIKPDYWYIITFSAVRSWSLAGIWCIVCWPRFVVKTSQLGNLVRSATHPV